MEKSILIIGAGKLGTSLFRGLEETRHSGLTLAGNKPFSAALTSHINQSQYYQDLNNSLISDHEIIFICVRDRQIKKVAEALMEFDVSGRFIFHTSGFRNSEDLGPLNLRGAATGSFHPVQSFPAPFSPADLWKNIYCTYEGQSEGKTVLEDLCRKLQAHLIPVTKEQKHALHLSAAIVTNYGVGLLGWAESVMEEQFTPSLRKELLQPMLESLVSNYSQHDVYEMLTGPLQRGDLEIIKGHLALLSDAERKLYLDFARTLIENDRFNIKNRKKIREFISAYSK